MKECPKCKSNLEGDLIFNTFFERYLDENKALDAAKMYGATKTEGRWSRVLAHYDMYQDRTVAFECPDCGYILKR